MACSGAGRESRVAAGDTAHPSVALKVIYKGGDQGSLLEQNRGGPQDSRGWPSWVTRRAPLPHPSHSPLPPPGLQEELWR